MGGEIGVQSQPGAGSTFWFELPLERAAEAAPSPERRPVAPARTPTAAPRGGAVAAGGAAAPLRVLLAEDNKVNQEFATVILRWAGHEVDVVENGLEAVEAVAGATRYDVVLMDVQMPELDGVEATARIRALAGPQRGVPIIALTANAMAGAREQYLAAGMDEYLSKPLHSATLLELLSRVAGARRVASPAPPPPAPARPAPAAAATEAKPILAAAHLDDLASIMEPEELRGYLASFLASCGERTGRLTTLSVDGELAALRREAHSLAGSSGNSGARRLSELARMLETACAAGDAPRAGRLVEELVASMAETKLALEAWLAGQARPAAA